MATPAPNPRASLLAGLRTGGVRSASNPIANVPHTAAPSGSFNVPRFVSHNNNTYIGEEEDELSDMVSQNMYVSGNTRAARQHQVPMTAAVDGPYNGFQQQQQELFRQAVPQRSASLNMNGSMSYGISPGEVAQAQAQAQALQMQMVQMEIMRLQAIQQAQQAQQAAQYAQATGARRGSNGFAPPATAGPLNTSFDLRSAAASAQLRARQTEQARAQFGANADDQVPMTAALGGKFGSRALNPNANSFKFGGEDNTDHGIAPATAKLGPGAPQNTPLTPSFTTVISGGTSLGYAANGTTPTNGPVHVSPTPSKSDAAVSWRRGSTNNSVLRSPTNPNVKVTPPPGERVSPPPVGPAPLKTRPQPLQFNTAVSQTLPAVVFDTYLDGIVAGGVTDADDATSSSTASNSGSSPTTPNSAGSNGPPPLSPREEASKRLYEGLGIGRPVPQMATLTRLVSHPVRQPRGPPSGADELGPKNFASRIRRQAIGGLGALMGARERREFVEAY